jgi:uncharacterized Rossmann fold enzyme
MNLEQYQQQHPDRSVFVVKGSCILSNDELYAQCAKAREAGFPQLVKAQIPAFDDPIIIVGSCPSAMECLEEIRDHADAGHIIMAIKGAHDWLIENGIKPTFAVACDPQESRHDVFKKLDKDVVYLCASQMHPATWDYMRGYRVFVWHCQIDAEQPAMDGWQGVPLVPGGSTTGMRAIPLAFVLGFRNFELYGYDSTLSVDGAIRTDGAPMREGDTAIDVWVGERQFRTTYELYPQIQALMPTLQNLCAIDAIKVNAYGDGLFQAVLRDGKLAGWPV